MQLFYVTVVDEKRLGARKSHSYRYVVMAERPDLAEAALRLDLPSAFVFAKRVTVEPCQHRFAALGSMMVTE